MLKEIEIIGLFGEMDIKVPLTGKNSISKDSEVVILIGENGSGKTTILNIINDVLNSNLFSPFNIKFEKINLITSKETVSITSEFINKINELFRETLKFNYKMVKKLLEYKKDSNFIEKFLNNLDDKNTKLEYLIMLENKNLITQFMDLFEKLKQISSNNIFYPTYRRIEKEVLESESTKNIYFGMNDIEKLIEDYILKLKNFSSIGYEEIKEVLENKDLDKIEEITKRIEKNKKVEFNKLNNFVIVCNKYLFNKKIIFISEKFEWYIEKRSKKRVNLNNLSSGEKQMVSIFAQLYLKDDKDLIILFDEPELSISLEWQKMLIPDMLKSNKIKQLIVATHSPFIFDDEELFKNTIDIDDYTTYSTDNE